MEQNEKPESAAAFERRRGPRRRYEHFDPETGERRTHDRRKTPGVEALFDKLLGVRETIPEPAAGEAEPGEAPRPEPGS